MFTNKQTPVHIRMGGVPEPFNLPWHWAAKILAPKGIVLSWKDYYGGTGPLAQALRADELDLASTLTESMIADLAKGNPSKLVKTYVQSPLVWGIHVAHRSTLEHVSELEGKKFAISRMGSGSHIMADVLAHQMGWQKKHDFVIVQNLDGGRAALADGRADVFMWEKFMTKPFVDNGEFRKIGELPTPWPSFMIAASNLFLAKHSALLPTIMNAVDEACSLMMQAGENTVEEISGIYNMQQEDAKAWLKSTTWQKGTSVSGIDVAKVLSSLQACGVLTETPVPSSIVHGESQ